MSPPHSCSQTVEFIDNRGCFLLLVFGILAEESGLVHNGWSSEICTSREEREDDYGIRKVKIRLRRSILGFVLLERIQDIWTGVYRNPKMLTSFFLEVAGDLFATASS